MSVLPVGMGSSGVDVGDIGHSLRLRASASAYLSRTFGSAGGTTWGLSLWLKKAGQGVRQTLISAGDNSNNFTEVYFDTDNKLWYRVVSGGSVIGLINSNQVFRDPTGHTHIVLTKSGTTIACKVNGGSSVAGGYDVTWTVTNSITSGDTFINSAIGHAIGARTTGIGVGFYLDGYLSRVCFIDGQALTPSSFGYLNTDINEWVSKSQAQVLAVVEAGGTNSFMLDFDDATSLTTLGYDKSSKNNDWTLNNVSLTAGVTYDSMADTPTNNYATLNPINTPIAATIISVLSEGALKATFAPSFDTSSFSTIPIPASNKIWAEVTVTNTGDTAFSSVGIAYNVPNNGRGKGVLYHPNGNKRIDGTATAYGATYTTGDVIGMEVNTLTNAVTFYKQTGGSGSFTSQGSISYTPTSDVYFTVYDVNASNGVFTWNFGQRPFNNSSLPSGDKSLCTSNLPAVAIPKPALHFDAKTRTGTGAAFNVTGIAFAPGLVWPKGRSGATDHVPADIVRGATKYLVTNSTAAEVTDAQSVTAFNSDGYSGGTMGALNTNAATYIDWMWKANGTGVSNTDGSITSTVSANPTAGFSIVTYTGTGANATVGHGLGVAPKMVITKTRSQTGISWTVGHSNLTSWTYRLYLEGTGAQVSDSTVWQSTAPSSTVFSVGTFVGTNYSGSTMVAYCFAEIPGYSKIGSYVGTGSADGQFVYCGFKPKFVLVKDTSAVGHWYQLDAARDTYNVMSNQLEANLANAEAAGAAIDATATGFKLRTAGGMNTNTSTYIFLAIADVAGKYSLAR